MTSSKVLHVIERFNVAGAEVVVRDLLTLFAGSKWQMEVCVLHDKGVIGAEMYEKGFPVHHLDWTNDNLNDAGVVKRLRRVINDVRPDIIHAHNVTPWYFATLASFGNRKVKRCATLHGFLTGDGVWKKKLLYVFLSHAAQRVAIVSPRIRTQLKTIPLFSMGRVEVIPNGIQTAPSTSISSQEKRAELGLQEDDFVIGTVGRMYPEKNIEMQIRLISQLRKRHPNVKLVIVAEKYGYFKVLEALVDTLGVKDQVLFTGLRRDVAEILTAFDLFIMTSFSEGTSIALLEAMAAGLPVVVSKVGGNRDIITHDQNGLLFDVLDMENLTRIVAALIKEDFRRKQLAMEARKTAKSYSITKLGEKYKSFYRAITNSGSHCR